MKRRQALLTIGAVVAAPVAKVVADELSAYPHDMALDPAFLPSPVHSGQAWRVLTDPADRTTLAAVFDRLIPSDDLGPSASQAGALEFLDAQLWGPFGKGATQYKTGPKAPGEDALMQKPQFIATPRERYATGIQALNTYAKRANGALFAALPEATQDQILAGMEDGSIQLSREVNTKAFFELLLMNVRESYFADPMYGGNRDMVGWKMIGFPGARYDYRLYADRTGQALNLTPVSLIPKD
ncbi:gluconate 2-dehydrogenase subunit 3 family protein [Stenotrophomonas sp. GD03993]|uniref:gluconate 2-dehydrogenase subunit 3 family protein n=1 Tax=unclassified Stenotrophomonas TaxID=196198 RepID=UPI0013111B42|nr:MULTISPECIES: gluconate 2-dehydrogenase subunit 3 family protein [unclassified Stenotrophomonas]MBH1460538.1 gluconate 2-dehydrogenase subunit 3 family protein [Stenotrophomonas maltophilia]MDH0189136.1 gluconate 2-dehydrogenase subunit 3 family protein [Stenotrophomonas sp. GD04051]MDH0465960.1 gluconate 2-dehydrogenase subunit 3 family protein [Stenotrophomonas sp. GD03993]MDH0876610.1 gluconate 2-dehydrogenase subunit 3 family protein [Stenotrophomonas sp. GD03877]MDH2157370.1 gluconate 